MRKISVADMKKLTDLTDILAKKSEEFEAFITELQEEVDSLNSEITDATAALRDAIEDIHNQASEYADERSDKWSESDNGQAYMEWVSHLESLKDMCEFEEYDLPDFEPPAIISEMEGIEGEPGL